MSFSYEIQYTKAAEKIFLRHEKVRTQFENAIHELLAGDHPERIDVKRIKAQRAEYYRIKLGNYRVVYTLVRGKVIAVVTLLAGARGDVYKKERKTEIVAGSFGATIAVSRDMSRRRVPAG